MSTTGGTTTQPTGGGGQGGSGAEGGSGGAGGQGGEGGSGGQGGSGGGAAESCAATWSRALSGLMPEAGVAGVVPAPDGSMIVGISFTGTVTVGDETFTSPDKHHDFLLVKLDADGVPEWSKHITAPDSQGFGIFSDGQGGLFLSGRIKGSVNVGGETFVSAGEGDALFARLDASGEVLWARRFGDADDQGGGFVATDGLGNVYVTGHFAGTLDLGGGPLTGTPGSNLFLAKLDADGAHVWSKVLGNPGELHGLPQIAVDANGDVVLTGLFKDTMSFGGNTLVSAGDRDIYLVKFSPGGEHVQSRRFGDAAGQTPLAVQPLPSGGLILAGLFRGTFDLAGGTLASPGSTVSTFVAELDGAGNHVRHSVFTGPDLLLPASLAVDPKGNVFLAGMFAGEVDFGGGKISSGSGSAPDSFLVKLGPSGEHLFSAAYGDDAAQSALYVWIDASGEPIVGSAFAGTIDLGAGPLQNAAFPDPAMFDVDLQVTKLACSSAIP